MHLSQFQMVDSCPESLKQGHNIMLYLVYQIGSQLLYAKGIWLDYTTDVEDEATGKNERQISCRNECLPWNSWGHAHWTTLAIVPKPIPNMDLGTPILCQVWSPNTELMFFQSRNYFSLFEFNVLIGAQGCYKHDEDALNKSYWIPIYHPDKWLHNLLSGVGRYH